MDDVTEGLQLPVWRERIEKEGRGCIMHHMCTACDGMRIIIVKLQVTLCRLIRIPLSSQRRTAEACTGQGSYP
jgi:hypothetical protein